MTGQYPSSRSVRLTCFTKLPGSTKHFNPESRIVFWRTVGGFFYRSHSLKTLTDQAISGRVERTSATETVDLDSIPSWVKPKTIKFGIHSFLA